jgi:hypothetical protein
MATEMTMKLAPKYTNTPNPAATFTIDKSVYEDIAEEFLDLVFISESKLEMDEWVELVAEK